MQLLLRSWRGCFAISAKPPSETPPYIPQTGTKKARREPGLMEFETNNEQPKTDARRATSYGFAALKVAMKSWVTSSSGWAASTPSPSLATSKMKLSWRSFA
jgi:hypothetical protein